MRIFFISDIHGNFCAFQKLIDHVKFDPKKDKLVIGGDMINRGPRSAQMLQWAKEYSNNHPHTIHIIAGNHEEMMIWFMKELSPIWMEFGGDETIESFKKVYGSENGWDIAENYAAWLETLPLIYEDEYAIYTHAGIDIYAEKDNQPRDIIWMNKSDLSQMKKENVNKWANGKLIYRGHNPASAVYKEGQFIHSDLGSGVFENERAALALVEVKKHRYFCCTMDGEVSARPIDYNPEKSIRKL
ncbi:hypothetical protein CIL05_05505 [Virgibacillus profundi]|uniref:Calcineurin-like phosphoesterase domain-containing protein n=1 Tax=Virgibacillus profundi TaxID=2024555 RepID=A0A2A2IFX4_9BACI|nr:metallophosphoesterase [Virgibacillus profundi]PAV30557.1 hypothetical protein CIL05_05505 [Virgibacillus profundi]PXY54729.1 hypothetical protein CIT14_05590 [Virgibacillus profundi]